MCEKVGFCPQEVIPPRGTSMLRLKSANWQSQVKAAGKIQAALLSNFLGSSIWTFFSFLLSHCDRERRGADRPNGDWATQLLWVAHSAKCEEEGGEKKRLQQKSSVLGSPLASDKMATGNRFSKENVFPVYILAGKSGKRAVVDLPLPSSFFLQKGISLGPGKGRGRRETRGDLAN